MKVGIITYHRAKNIGAMLQSYALQTKIQEYLGSCEIIDYRNDKMEEAERVKSISEVKGIKQKIKNILLMKKNKEFEIVRNNFNNDIQKISKKTYNNDNISEANKNYDLFITGSDQVWNQKLNYCDKNYFLDFVKENKKRNSYAASFGTNELEMKDEEIIIKELKNYNKISVREKEGQVLINRLIDRDSELVLDPTFLLDINEWEKLIDKKKLVEEKYIFVYTIAYTPTIFDFARKLGKKEHCKIICFNNGYKKYRGMKNLNKVSPQDFLNYIKNAEYIVTSSFHGLCYSINFHKNFYYELDENKKNNNSRLITLTKMLDLEKRRIIDGKCEDNKIICYEKVDEKLKIEKQKSIKFIKELGE